MKEKIRTVSPWKKLIAIVLTFVLFFGGINIMPKEAGEVEAAGSGITVNQAEWYIDGGQQAFYINFNKTTNPVTETDNPSWKDLGSAGITGIYINGVQQTPSDVIYGADWVGGSSQVYRLAIKGSALSGYSGNDHQYYGTNYITIKANSTIGSFKFDNDVVFKLVGYSTGASAYTTRKAYAQALAPSEVPSELFLSRVAYNDNGGSDGYYLFYFRNKQGGTYTEFSGADVQITMDGTSKFWAKVYGEASGYYIKVPYTSIKSGATSYSNVGEHYFMIPSGTINGTCSFGSPYYFKIYKDGNYGFELKKTSVSYTRDINVSSDQQYYVIELAPDDGRQIVYSHSGTQYAASADSATVQIDGASKSVRQWIYYSKTYGLTIHASTIESTYVYNVGSHTLKIPAGTVMGDVVTTNELTFKIHGRSIQPVTKLEFVTEWGTWNDNWYALWLRPEDGLVDPSIYHKKDKVIVDGVERELDWAETDVSRGAYCLVVRFNELEQGAKTAQDVKGTHYVIIPAGLDLGGRQTENDICIKISGTSVTQVTPITATLDQGAADETNQHFVFYLKPSSGSIVAPGDYASQVAYIDGVQVEGAIYQWKQGKESYGACIKYDLIESGMTSAGSMRRTHGVIIPKGTYVGNMVLGEDHYFRLERWNVHGLNTWTTNESQVMDALPKFTGNYHRHAAYDDGSWYHVIFKIHPRTIPDAMWASTTSILVDGELVSGVGYDVFYEDGAPALGLNLPYDLVQKGATSYSQITSRKLITIPKGTPIEKGFLDRDITFSVQGSSITEIVAPVAELHTSIRGGDASILWFQTYPQDKLPKSQHYYFASQGVYVDGVQQPSVPIYKFHDYAVGDAISEYYVQPKNVVTGSVVVVKGSIQDTKYNVTFMELSAKWDGSKWVEWFEKSTTSVRLKADTRNGSPSTNRIYIRASEDPMLKGPYAPSDFDNGGIIYQNNTLVNANFVKQSEGMYYIDISANPGDIIKVSGTYPLSRKRQVRFNDIYFIKNTDGSFSEYSPNAEAVPAKTVSLDTVYVNLDKDGGYDPTFASLIAGETNTTIVDGVATTSKITTPGTRTVSRTLGNASKIRAVGDNFGDITYTQTVVTYKTGDANNNGVVDIKDLVNVCKKVGSSGSMRGRDDLDYTDTVTSDDPWLLMDMLTKAKTAADIYNKDNSLNIGSMSDTHYQESGRDGQTRINTIKALNYYKSQNVDVLIMNGDVVDLGHVSEYQALVTDIKKVYSDSTTYPKFIITGDNHEWYDAWTVNGHVPAAGVTFYTTQDRFNAEFSALRDGSTDTNTYYVENGYHFIGISSDGMPPGSGQCTYDAETINFAREKLNLARAADPNRPIFLAIHQAPPNTVKGSDGADCFDSADMDALLKNYPNLIVTTGHTHVPLQNENSIHQAYYTTVQSGSTHYVGGVNEANRMSNYQGTKADGTVYDGNDQMSEKYEFSQGLIFRVKGNVVDIERRDFYNDDEIAPDKRWKVTIGDLDDYPKMTYETDRGGSGDQVVITETGSSVSWVSNTEARIKLAMITESTYVDRYVVSVVENGVPIRTIEYSGLAYLGLNSSRYRSPVLPITGLDAWKQYTFYVTAIDAYGNGTSGHQKTFTLNPR